MKNSMRMCFGLAFALFVILVILSTYYFKLSMDIGKFTGGNAEYTVVESAVRIDADEFETDVINITTSYYPPYVYEENGQIVGMDYEILSSVLQDMGVQYKIEMMPWASGIHKLDTGTVYAVFPYAWTQEREKNYAFSEKFHDAKGVYNYYTYKGNKASGKINTVEDLKKFRVGAVSGYFYVDMFDKMGITYELCSDEEEALMKLKQDRIDVLPMNALVAGYIIENDFPSEGANFVYSNLELNFEGSGDFLMLNKENPDTREFIDKFNESLAKLKKNGTIDKIAQRYMNR